MNIFVSIRSDHGQAAFICSKAQGLFRCSRDRIAKIKFDMGFCPPAIWCLSSQPRGQGFAVNLTRDRCPQGV